MPTPFGDKTVTRPNAYLAPNLSPHTHPISPRDGCHLHRVSPAGYPDHQIALACSGSLVAWLSDNALIGFVVIVGGIIAILLIRYTQRRALDIANRSTHDQTLSAEGGPSFTRVGRLLGERRDLHAVAGVAQVPCRRRAESSHERALKNIEHGRGRLAG